MKSEFRKLHQSFRAAWCGIQQVVRNERNFRIHITVMFYVLLFAWLGQVENTQLAVLCACFGLVLSAELFNTAIELLCDRISTRYEQLLGKIKDVAAAGVLVCALTAAAAGLFIFLSAPVLTTILKTLYTVPWLTIAIICTIPCALLFIFYFGNIHSHR